MVDGVFVGGCCCGGSDGELESLETRRKGMYCSLGPTMGKELVLKT